MMAEIDSEVVKKTDVTVSPLDKHGDKAWAAKTGDHNIEPRGGDYAKNINETGSPKTALEGGAGVGAWWTEVAILSDVPKPT